MTIEERVTRLEKEIADLKQQLEERPIKEGFYPCDASMEAVKQKS